MSATPELELLQRALVLLDIGRPEQAERMLREVVSEEPDDPLPRAVLSLVLSDLERYGEAEDYARQAIALDPEFAVAHGALARAFAGQKRFRDAYAPTREAIRLDPEDHTNHELLAACQLAAGDWPGACESAERALRLVPDSASALGIHAAALAMTGNDPDAWRSSAAAALAADPGSSAAHALSAYAHLTRGQERDAVAGFEEALRLEPDSEHLQAGLAEALKAAHPLYRPIFRFFMWQQRLSTGARTALIVVPLLVARVLRLDAGNPFVLGLLVVWFTFVALTWVATPIANLALRFSPRGRAVLPADQKRSSTFFAALVGGCLLSVLLAALVSGVFAGTALALGLLAFSVGSGHTLSSRRRRVLDAVGGAAVVAAFLGAALVALGVHAGVVLVLAAVFAGLGLLWFVRLG